MLAAALVGTLAFTSVRAANLAPARQVAAALVQ